MGDIGDRYAWLAEDAGRGADRNEHERESGGDADEVGREARRVGGARPGTTRGGGADVYGVTARQTPTIGKGTAKIGRRRDPRALRNDPSRKQIGAYVRKDIKREVDLALAEGPAVSEGGLTLSLLVEGLLQRWLEEQGREVGGAS